MDETINSSYKLIEFLSSRGSGADTIVNVAYEKIGVAGSHFGTHGHIIDLFIITASEWKTVKC